MPSKRHYARVHRQALIQDLLAQLKEEGELIAETAGNLAETIIRRTLRYSTQFGAGGPSYVGGGKHKKHQGLRDANVLVDTEVKVSKRGLQIFVYVTVIDPSGRPHFVWHLISEGRAPFTQRRRSPPIRERSGLRTRPDDLEVTGFPGFSGDVFVINQGQRVAGIEARRWYLATSTAFQTEMKRLVSLSSYGLTFKQAKIRNLL